MARENMGWPFSNAPALGEAFGQEAESPSAQSDQTLTPQSVAETAAAEIQNHINHEAALDHHEDVWRTERGKLANAPSLNMDPPDMGSSSRSLQNEYAARRGDWERQREAIDAQFSATGQMIREEGATLSDAFDDALDIDGGADFVDGIDDGISMDLDDDMSHGR